MTIARRVRPRKISLKRLKALGGKMPFRSAGPSGKRPKARNAKRSAKERVRANGTPARVEWMHAQPCVITGMRPVEIVHVRTGGMGRKADASETVPMLARLHRELHRIGITTFEAKYTANLGALASRIDAAWLAQQGD